MDGSNVVQAAIQLSNAGLTVHISRISGWFALVLIRRKAKPGSCARSKGDAQGLFGDSP
jgi:hypothetical protein